MMEMNHINEEAFFIDLMTKKLVDTTVLEKYEVENYLSSFTFVLGQVERSNSVEEDFSRGIDKIRQKVEDTKKLYESILSQFVSYDVTSLTDTIQSFQEFFKYYDVVYGAHLTTGMWIDYQLFIMVDDTKIKGIDFVFMYLTYLKKELDFLNQIPKQLVLNTLDKYSLKLGFDYRIDVNNIYEVIFNQLMIIVFFYKKANHLDSLEISTIEGNYLLANKREFERFCKTHSHFIKDFYYSESMNQLIKRLNQVKNMNELRRFLLIKRENKQTSSFLTHKECLEGVTLSQSKREFYKIYDQYIKNQVETSELSKKIDLLTAYDFLGLILLHKREQRKEWLAVKDIKEDEEKSEMLEVIKNRVSMLTRDELDLLEYYLSQSVFNLSDFE